jgi:hypothetical protein
VPQLPATRAGLLVFRQIVDDLLPRQVGRQAPPAVAVGRTCGRGRRGLRRRRGDRRDQLVQQRLEELHLLRIELLGRASIEPPQQRLELVLQLLDRAGVLGLLLQELLSLGAEQFILLLEPLQLAGPCVRRTGTLLGHACSIHSSQMSRELELSNL